MLQNGRLAWFDRSGSPLGTVGLDGYHDYSDFRLSSDETRLAASLVDAQLSLPDIWMIDLVRGGNSRLTFGPALNAAAVWSPRGDRIAFRTNRKGLTELYHKSAIASGDDQPLLLEDAARASAVASSNVTPSDWSPDGQYVAFASGAPSDVWLLALADGAKPTRFVQSPGDQMHANFSPEGRFIAYTSNESGRYEVYVETLPVSERKWPISTSGGYEPRWRADGREIYYLSEDRRLMAVPVTSGTSPFGVPRPLFQTQVHAGVSLLRTHYVPSGDGSRFLIHVRSAEMAPAALTIVLNATTVLKP
jgi:Tol biopolymer transport system component